VKPPQDAWFDRQTRGVRVNESERVPVAEDLAFGTVAWFRLADHQRPETIGIDGDTLDAVG